jgi:hypothetical protein
MFKKIATKIKQAIFKAQKIQADGPMAKAQAKIIDDLVNQADAVAEIAKDAAKNIVADAKKEVKKATAKAKTTTVKKDSAAPKKGRPKKDVK